MNRLKILLILSVMAVPHLRSVSQERPSDLANPLIDTHKSRYDYFISAALPFGMVSLSPDMKHGEMWNSGYLYDEKYILNFSHVHNGQTAGIPVMPVVGECKGYLGLEASKSEFSHDKEVVKVGYHKVFLEDSQITAELTATCRVGMHRYTFPAADTAHIIFDLSAALGATKTSYAYARKISSNEIEGYSLLSPTFRRKKPYLIFFVAQFDKPFDSFNGWEKNKEGIRKIIRPEENLISGDTIGAYVTYRGLKNNEQICIKVGISFVSTENARMNLSSELPHWNFDKVVKDAAEAWDNYLSRVLVEGGTREQRIKLYTDLMHTASKRISDDVDGSYMDWTGMYPVARKLPLGSDNKPTRHFIEGDGLWGGQWNLNVFWTLLYPEYGNWMVETFLDYYRNAGTMARCSWGGNYSYVMVGDHTTPLIAALLSSKRATFDPVSAYIGARKNAFPGGIRDRGGYEAGPHPSGGGMDWYVEKGYVPIEIRERGEGFHREGAAMTLEYAYQDWCLAQMAGILKKSEDRKLFIQRSENWRNVFDPAIGWSRPRHVSGEWLKDFTPVVEKGKFNSPGFIEGSSATYTFYVPQNMEGLIQEMGGNKKFIEKLESNFLKAKDFRFIAPHGEHGSAWVDYENQPSLAMAHLFSHAGAPWKTQYWVREVKEKAFGGVDPYSGYNGDEDQGMLGALGVLMAIGLFDLHGCVGEFPELEITSPLFDKIVLRFPSLADPLQNTLFRISVKKKNPADIYIQHAILNGIKWSRFQFPVTDFLNGGELELELGPYPNKKWGKPF